MPLPDPSNHLTLKQISQRWECDEDRLIQYCMSGQLDLSILLTGEHSLQHYVDEEGKAQCNGAYILRGIYKLPNLFVKNISGGASEVLHEIYSSGFKPFDDYDHDDYGASLSTTYELLGTHPFTLEDLVISKSERDRFEKEHDIKPAKSTGETTSADKPLDPREKTTWAQIVKTLCLEQELPLNNPYKAAEIIQQIAANHGVNVPLKKDTIAKRLKELPED